MQQDNCGALELVLLVTDHPEPDLVSHDRPSAG